MLPLFGAGSVIGCSDRLIVGNPVLVGHHQIAPASSITGLCNRTPVVRAQQPCGPARGPVAAGRYRNPAPILRAADTTRSRRLGAGFGACNTAVTAPAQLPL